MGLSALWASMTSEHMRDEAPVVTTIPNGELPKTFEEKFTTNDLLYDLVFSYCSPATFLRVSRTCRAANAAVKSYMGRAMNINRIFSRFFSEPLGFRKLQARTGTLVSGSAALQFFDRSFYAESDLDVYVPKQFRKDVGRFLFDEGYKFVPNAKQDPDFWAAVNHPRVLDSTGIYAFRGVSGVFTFEKEQSGEKLKVQLIVSVHSPMEIILGFHSTCVMNVISFEKAYSLYPKATFEERCSLICASDGPKQEPAMEKYEQRGWKMIRDAPSDDLQSDFHFLCDSFRWMGDHHCWTIQLDVTGISDRLRPNAASPRLLHDPVAASSWMLDHNSDDGGIMDFKLTEDENLYLSYVYAIDEVLARLESVTPEHRPSETSQYYDMGFLSMCILYFRCCQDLQATIYAMTGDKWVVNHL